MQEAQDVTEVEYEAPELTEVGDFSALTLGFAGFPRDLLGGFFGF